MMNRTEFNEDCRSNTVDWLPVRRTYKTGRQVIIRYRDHAVFSQLDGYSQQGTNP